MMEKKELIHQIIGFQDEMNRMILEYRVKNWLSIDLTIAQLKSILYIYSKGKANFSELATALNVTPSVVTGIVDRLVLQKMVKRIRTRTSGDRRVQWLVVTDKGKGILDGIRQQTIDNISQILETLNEEDLAALSRGFSAFIEATGSYLTKKNKTREIIPDKADEYSPSEVPAIS